MSNTLITILENETNLLRATHFINSFVRENPHTEISVMTYAQNKKIINLLPNIKDAYFIDAQDIASTLENPLFSDAYAINALTDSLQGCLERTWDEVINYSNDRVGSYIVSALAAHRKTGTVISTFGGPTTSNQWATYLNFVNTNRTGHLISNNTARHYMLNMPCHKEGKKIKINEDYSSIAAQNMTKIRKSKETTSNADIVAISLEEGSSGESIDFHSLCEIIDTLESSERYRVVLLLNGKETEKTLVNDLNYKFDNKLISINCDYTTLPSVLMSVDALVSVPNTQMAIADALETQIIEIHTQGTEESNFSTVNAGNYLIKQMKDENICSDVNFILNQEFETSLPVDSMNSCNRTYTQLEDDFGMFSTQIRGELNLQLELRYHIERMYHYQLMGYPQNEQLVNHLKQNTKKEDLELFTTQVKDELTDTVKILLAALRSLKSVRQSKSNLQKFIGYLDTLIVRAKSESMTSGALAIFEGEIENINSTETEDNIKAIEQNLFGLKNNLQMLANILTEIVTESKDTKTKQAQV